MSLLLGLREWVGLEEAMKIAIGKGLFPGVNCMPESNQSLYSEIRRDLLIAYAELQLPMRLAAATKLYIFTPNDDEAGYPYFLNLSEATVKDHAWEFPEGNFTRAESHAYTIKYEDIKNPEAVVWIDNIDNRPFEPANQPRKTVLYLLEYSYGFSGFSIIKWNDAGYSPAASLRNFLEVNRPKLEAMLDRATEKAGKQSAAPADESDISLPSRTVHTLYEEYRAMAETIAVLAKKPAKDLSSLANIVIDECAKSGNPMPVQHRTVKSRLDKA